MAIKWPLAGSISSHFGDTKNRPNPHSGTDVRGVNGSPIVAGAAGRVHHVGPNPAGPSSGNVVTIIYPIRQGDLYALYCHAEARYPVAVGDRVVEGTDIAFVGSSGNSSGGHVHIGCYLNGKLVNPEHYFSGVATRKRSLRPGSKVTLDQVEQLEGWLARTYNTFEYWHDVQTWAIGIGAYPKVKHDGIPGPLTFAAELAVWEHYIKPAPVPVPEPEDPPVEPVKPDPPAEKPPVVEPKRRWTTAHTIVSGIVAAVLAVIGLLQAFGAN